MPTLAKMGDVEMYAFCDIIPERAEEAARKYGCPGAKIYTDYKELLADQSINNVRVLTHNSMHCEITVAALEAGKHVLCEKPLAITYEEALKMTEASKRSGKFLTVGYQHRYNPTSVYMKKEVEKGTLGKIYFAKTRVLRRRGVPTWGVFTQKEKQGGGALADIATHSLDTTLWLMNNYKPKYIAGTTYAELKDQKELANPWGPVKLDIFDVEESGFGFLVMENGASIIIEASWLLNSLETTDSVNYLLCGTEAGADNFTGNLRINGVCNNSMYITTPDFKAGGVAFYEGVSHSPVEIEQRTFIDAITGKGELCVKAEQAAVVVRILEGLYKSAATGKAVYFD